MRRKQLVAVIVALLAVAAAVAVASRGGGTKPVAPAGNPAQMTGVGDDDANVMRRLQRDKIEKSHK